MEVLELARTVRTFLERGTFQQRLHKGEEGSSFEERTFQVEGAANAKILSQEQAQKDSLTEPGEQRVANEIRKDIT